MANGTARGTLATAGAAALQIIAVRFAPDRTKNKNSKNGIKKLVEILRAAGDDSVGMRAPFIAASGAVVTPADDDTESPLQAELREKYEAFATKETARFAAFEAEEAERAARAKEYYRSIRDTARVGDAVGVKKTSTGVLEPAVIMSTGAARSYGVHDIRVRLDGTGETILIAGAQQYIFTNRFGYIASTFAR